MLHGSRECALSCVRLFRCEQVIQFNEFLFCEFANIYILPSAICRVRIGRQVAHLGLWRLIYNYKEKNLSVSVCGDGVCLHPHECTHSHRTHPQRVHALILLSVHISCMESTLESCDLSISAFQNSPSILRIRINRLLRRHCNRFTTTHCKFCPIALTRTIYWPLLCAPNCLE